MTNRKFYLAAGTIILAAALRVSGHIGYAEYQAVTLACVAGYLTANVWQKAKVA